MSGYDARCKICKGGIAERVNNLLVLGFPYEEIARIINEEKGYNYIYPSNINRHKKHLDEKTKTLLLLREKRKLENLTMDFVLSEVGELLIEFITLGATNILGGDRPLDSMTKDLIDKWLKAIDLLIKSGELGEKEVVYRYQSLTRAFEVFSDIVKTICTPEQRSIIEKEYLKAKAYINGDTDTKPKFTVKEIMSKKEEPNG